jgi:TonB-dependent SusC/RagA subfamily outer membrane receptor
MRLSRVPRVALTLARAIAIVATSASVAWAQGTITGTVTAQGSAQPLEEVRVIVIGTSVFTTTGADGRYTLRNVPAGTVDIRVLRVGYQEQKKPITVAAGQATTLNFVMAPTVVQLQEVVTTATGEQRRVELGNSVATVNVAKQVQETPIKNMGDLLVAKAPGVQVLPSNMTGGGARVRIRGTSSLSLSNDPIYIIDGIRMTSNSASAQIGVGGTSPSRVSDINPEEIETLEIVKGPSAATLYGTDAANGVIVITTKKGRAGAARWNVFAEQGRVQDNNNYPSTYAILGHAPATPGTVRRCLLTQIAAATCVADSSSVLDIFDDPDLTVIKNGWRNNVGLQVSGGTEAIRYFTSGEFENEIGPFGMPAFENRRYAANNWTMLGEWKRPNALQKSSARANINATISPTLDLSVQSGFIKLDQRLPQVDNNVNSFWFNAMTGPGFKGAGPGYTGVGSLGQPLMGYASFTPGDIFQRTTTQGVQRFIGSMNADWRPLSWLQNRADLGLDLADRVEGLLQRFAQGPDFSTQRQGISTDARTNIRNFTANLGSTASWQAKPWMGFKTTGGVQYVNYELTLEQAQGQQLVPGATTPDAGTIPNITSGTTRTKTLGLFVEEAAAIRDRLFLTAAVRTDQNSAFGTNFQRVYYPKGSVSWLVSDESFFPQMDWMNQLRLRASVGASGVQPGPNDAARF